MTGTVPAILKTNNSGTGSKQIFVFRSRNLHIHFPFSISHSVTYRVLPSRLWWRVFCSSSSLSPFLFLFFKFLVCTFKRPRAPPPTCLRLCSLAATEKKKWLARIRESFPWRSEMLNSFLRFLYFFPLCVCFENPRVTKVGGLYWKMKTRHPCREVLYWLVEGWIDWLMDWETVNSRERRVVDTEIAFFRLLRFLLLVHGVKEKVTILCFFELF